MHKRISSVVLICACALSVGCSRAKKESITLTNRGVEAFNRQQYDAAYALFQRALEVYPENAAAYYQMGLIDFYHQDDPRKALVNLEKANELKPNDRDTLFALARLALDKHDDPKGALEHCEAVLAIDKNYAPAWFVKGKALKKLERFDDADAAWRESIAIDPEYSRAFVALAAMYEEFEVFEAARGVYEAGLEHNPLDTDMQNGLGVLELDAGKIDSALELFKGVVNRDQSRSDAVFNLAFANVKAGKPKLAIKYLDGFLQIAASEGDKHALKAARGLKETLALELYQ